MQFALARRKRDEEHILPLVNVVFLLLIFFMLAGAFSSLDPIGVEPPRSNAEGEPGEHDLVITFGADQQLAVDGRLIERAVLGDLLRERLAETPEHMVWLKADHAADALDVMALLETLNEAGVTRARLLTLPAAQAIHQ